MNFVAKNILPTERLVSKIILVPLWRRSMPARKMPVQKIEKRDFMLRCWEVFHRQGYYNTSMDDLAKATGLKKAGLYHHYPTKQALMESVLVFAVREFRSYVLSVANDTELPVEQRLEKMLRRQRRLAVLERKGCFFANVALETGNENLFNHILREVMEEWTQTFAGLYRSALPAEEAYSEARRLIMEYEGAVVFYKMSGTQQYLEEFVERAVKAFSAMPRYSETIDIHH